MKVKKGTLLIVALWSIGNYSEAAEKPGYEDHSGGLYPTQIFKDCLEGKLQEAFQASPKELFQRNKDGYLPVHFALIREPFTKDNKVSYEEHQQWRRKLVTRCIALADDSYGFVYKDLWPSLFESEDGADVEIVKQGLDLAKELRASNSWLWNMVDDPLWNLLVYENKNGDNFVYTAARRNSDVLEALLRAAEIYGKTQDFAVTAFRRALHRHDCSIEMHKELNKYMKLTREEMQAIMLEYSVYDEKMLATILNDIFIEG